MLGLDAIKVYEYLDLLADQVGALERELGEARADNDRLRAELHRLQADLDEFDQVGDRVNEQVVQLFSQAQLIAEEMVADVSRDARERIGQAREHERKIVEEATMAAGEHVRSYARTAQSQMQSIVESFAHEIDRLGTPPPPDDSTDATKHGPDPLFDDLNARQAGFRNGSGPHSPGSD
jgi:cell division septum initiation protein DivIVA